MSAHNETIAAARARLAPVALEVAQTHGAVIAATALAHLALQLLLETHPKAEILKWWQHQAKLIELSDLGKPSGQA